MMTVSGGIQEILHAYCPESAKAGVRPLGRGNINDTWLVDDGEARFVLQKINPAVFPSPETVIANFSIVTSHINSRENGCSDGLVCPHLVPTRDGSPGFCDKAGNWWRAQSYIGDSVAPTTLVSTIQAEKIGRVLALFHRGTADLRPEDMGVPLPGFHVTSLYLQTFDGVLANVVGADRRESEDCLYFLAGNRNRALRLERAMSAGRLTCGVVHGDPKVDNVIFDLRGLPVGLFDLDTVGPGLLLHDLGDCLRSVCHVGGEEQAGGEAVLDLNLLRALLTGYLHGVGNMLGGEDRNSVFDALFTIAFELGLRFLTDHFAGNRYFKVKMAGQNLRRARSQFGLAQTVLNLEGEIRGIAANI